jgi:hypothetical protein
MTTFKEIRGTAIQVVSSDPSNPETGQIWYNSSSGTLKGYQLATVNVWSSGGNLNNARKSVGSAGTQTAAIGVGGFDSDYSKKVESYNGTSWSNLTDFTSPLGRSGLAVVGTQTATLAWSGGDGVTYPAVAFLYNGTSWTTGTNMPIGRSGAAGSGTQTSALSIGGYNDDGQPGYLNTCFLYNGSWTSTGNLNTARNSLGASAGGTQTATLAFGGQINSAPTYSTNATESFNGTSWTSVNSLNTSRNGVGGAGTQTTTLAFGGNSPPSTALTATELWNGTSWTSNPTGLATARGTSGTQAGTQAAALNSSSNYPSAATEEWNTTILATRTITVS